jgi:hypothetical protein
MAPGQPRTQTSSTRLPLQARLPFTEEVPKPPAPPPPPRTALDEVERAISILDGRHPEHERTRRETLAAAEERRKAIEKELAQSARRRLGRAGVIAANLAALGAVGFVAWRFVARASQLRDALARDEAPFVAHGLSEIASNALSGAAHLEVDAPARSCFVALATSGTVVVRATGATVPEARAVGWCACAAGHVAIDAAAASHGSTGVALLRIDDKVLGGRLARPWAPIHPDAWAETGGETGGEASANCDETELDAWIADHGGPAPSPTSDVELDSAPGAITLRAAGLHVVSRVADGAPFAVVQTGANECHMAIGVHDDLALRATGGARPIDHAQGFLVWCASLPDTVTIWRNAGAAPVLVLTAPADRLGGLLGSRECARDAGYVVGPTAAFISVDDQGWDATSILKASALRDVATAVLPTAPGARDLRVAAIVAAAGSRVTWDPSMDVASCDPPLEAGAAIAEAVCAPSLAAAPWRKGDASACAARAELPIWMSLLAQRHEADAIARVPELLTLTRRMIREGFEPTVLEGVTELRDGVRVAGRAGEDAIVAVGLSAKPPWVHPYSDDVPWDLGDAPRIVPLQPGSFVMLHASPSPSVPIDKRRTVVFRRTSRL